MYVLYLEFSYARYMEFFMNTEMDDILKGKKTEPQSSHFKTALVACQGPTPY